MKRNLIFFILTLLSSYGFSQTISPAENAEFCAHFSYSGASQSDANVVRFLIDMGSGDIGLYTILQAGTSVPPAHCKVVSNLHQISPSQAECYIAFEDQTAAVASFTLGLTSDGTPGKTFKFPFIRSLKGLKTTLGHPANLNFPLCTTGLITYSFDSIIYYRRSDTKVKFGGAIPLYEYSVPEGWKVGNVTSTGPNNYITDVPNANITYDEIHTGEVKIRATQKGYVCDVVNLTSASDWVSLPFTRPAVSYAVDGQASSLNLTCGETTTHTFSVANGLSNSCFTYVWNLSSDNNNWLYNGSPAPQFITTTTNSITLTTAGCSGKPGNVAVTIRYNNIDYKFPAIPVSLQIPQYAISGSGLICTAENYVIQNLPCNVSVDWSTDPVSIATVTPNGNSATVTKTGNGVVRLKAIISGMCGSGPVELDYDIKVGPPVTFTGSVDAMALMQCNKLTTQSHVAEWTGFVTVLDPVATTYSWNLEEKGSTTAANLQPNPDAQHVQIIIKAPLQGWGTFRLTRTNQCGAQFTLHTFRGNWDCLPESRMDVSGNADAGEAAAADAIILAPNPARNEVNIASHGGTGEISEIKIFDVMGRLIKKQLFKNTANVKVNTSDLLNGLYFVEITVGKERIKKNLTINR